MDSIRNRGKAKLMKRSVGIIGCGRVGITLAAQLVKAGYPVIGLAHLRTPEGPHPADALGVEIKDAVTLSKTAEILFLTTPDDRIAPSCTTIAEMGGFFEGQRVFHCSGSLASTLLAPAAENGALIGSLHPLQSFAEPEMKKNPFAGIIMAVEGHPDAVETGLSIAALLCARGITIRTDAKVLYHAAAVVASNYFVTLMDFAFDLLDASGIEAQDAMAVLGPLVDGTLKNLKKTDPPTALTGPVARGDVAIIDSHLEAICRDRPERERLYRELGRFTLEVARKKGTLTPGQEAAFADRFPS